MRSTSTRGEQQILASCPSPAGCRSWGSFLGRAPVNFRDMTNDIMCMTSWYDSGQEVCSAHDQAPEGCHVWALADSSRGTAQALCSTLGVGRKTSASFSHTPRSSVPGSDNASCNYKLSYSQNYACMQLHVRFEHTCQCDRKCTDPARLRKTRGRI